MTAGQTNEILDAIAAVAEPVALRFLWRPRLQDPADEMVLDTAVNGQADRLVTFNLRHLRDAAMIFGIRANPPGETWREIRGAMRKSNVALRLQTSLLEEAKRVAEAEGVALNQLINVAVAEKLSALRTEDYFRERSARATSAGRNASSSALAEGTSRLPGTSCRQRGRKRGRGYNKSSGVLRADEVSQLWE